MAVLVCRDATKLQFISDRTRETLLELKMCDGTIVIWGSAKRDAFAVHLEDDGVHIAGELADSIGPVVRFGDTSIEYLATVRTQIDRVEEAEPFRDWSTTGGLKTS